MKRLLVDTNLILDALVDRPPHAESSTAVWAVAETGPSEGFPAAHAIATIHYLVQREIGPVTAKQLIADR
jgi:predicted nucleic acid-binding protein